MSDTTNNKRIAKNTFVLYVQMLISMLIGLYISRVVLNVLGVVDFGIYNVVGGVVAMFGVLNSAMSSSTSRFITFALGLKDSERLKSVFSMSLIIHLIIAVLLCVAAESIGLWFLKTRLQIPPVRLEAAIWVLHFSVLTAFISIINASYNAIILAHEQMSVFAYFSIVDMLLKLVVVFLLQMIDFDKLKVYAIMLAAVQILIQILIWLYCYKNFKEARVGLKWNRPLFKEMSSFAGWSMFGDSAVLLFTQGINILLNIFFGATVNAARGIAIQVQGVISRFISGFQTALNPQITKSYAAHDLAYMYRLIYTSSKYSFFLLLLLALPVFVEADHILTWWLKILPEHTVNFVRIMLLISLIDTLANPLVFAAKATGKIMMYQSILGSLLLLVVPLSYGILKLGYPPEAVFFVHLIITIIGQVIRVWLVSDMIKLPIWAYIKQVVIKCLIVMVLAPLIPLFIFQLIEEPILRLLVITLTSTISILTIGYTLALDQREKIFIMDTMSSVFKKFKRTPEC